MEKRPPAVSWDEIVDTFTAAVELPPAERLAWLESVCAGREALRLEVEAMLLADGGDARLDLEEQLLTRSDSLLAEGTVLGRYRVGRWLGSGGMGEVYLGVRADADYEQLVAVKVLRHGVAGPDAAARFRREQRILAHLTHPAIAPLLDSGVAPDGRPFLVLQYVEGEPITRYCDARKLPVEGRLRLFADVCRAVQHAHGRLIIHRDLKPSNILVTAEGEIRLLDFGIAKALTPDDTDGDLTRNEPAPMTLERAAPEQLRGERPSTATDVWGLGVLLYELLAGRLPFSATGSSRDAVERAITQGDLVPPSAAVRQTAATDAAAAAAIAEARDTTVDRLRAVLRRDLDTVVAVALRLEPERRYASAGQIADDVERVLAGEPVLARPQSLGYRLRRFAGRNRAPVAAGALAIAAGIAFTITTALQSAQVARERDRAAAEEAKANAVVDLLTEVLGGADPNQGASGPTVNVDELLARGEKRAAELSAQPAVQARLWHVLGEVQRERSAFGKARDLLARAHAAQVAISGPDDARAIEMAVDLAQAERKLGMRAAAEARLRSVVRQLESQPDRSPALLADALGHLAMVTEQKHRVPLLQRALALRRASSPPQPVAVARALNDLGIVTADLGRRAEAERHYREALALLRGTVGLDHPYALSVRNNLALIVANPPEQESLYRSLIAAHRKRFGDPSQQTATAWNNLGTALTHQGRYEAAMEAMTEARRRWERLVGRDHPQTLNTRRSVAAILLLRGHTEESLREISDVLATAARVGMQDHIHASLRVQRAVVLYHLGRLDEAKREMVAAYDDLRRLQPPGSSYRTAAQFGVGMLLLAEGDAAGAEREFREVLAIRERTLRPDHPALAEVRVALGRALLAEGRPAEGRDLIAGALPAFSAWGAAHPADVEAARQALRNASD